eukprot:CAMPEP_0119068150 /NCGR_PEP_ID=MMETSP1178-20130426/10547_1 /TAXON_ID=33656 /ORGANISM="unid sp, Strain CCMP2000" /LENGTH=31 /DNA_ID= /DNA_START= /DNA_END= /DNA_ORIENTATION=
MPQARTFRPAEAAARRAAPGPSSTGRRRLAA